VRRNSDHGPSVREAGLSPELLQPGYQAEVGERAARAPDRDALDRLEREVLGKSSVLAACWRAIGAMAETDRREAGQSLGRLRAELEEILTRRRQEIEDAEREASLEADWLDLTEILPSGLAGHFHPVTVMQERLEEIFLGMGYEVAEGPEIETDRYNFDALNFAPDHPARSAVDTFYLEENSCPRAGDAPRGSGGSDAARDSDIYLLRTHTSPMQVHLLERGELPIYAVVPGLCHRRDTPDPSHLASFHQLEALVVDRGVTFGDLAGTIDTFIRALFGPATRSRLRPGYFPFTEPSAELDISCVLCSGQGCRTCGQSGWLELGGAGMVHPAVLRAGGVDPEAFSGFAFGFGIDRLAIMALEVPDLRMLIDNDVRFLGQVS